MSDQEPDMPKSEFQDLDGSESMTRLSMLRLGNSIPAATTTSTAIMVTTDSADTSTPFSDPCAMFGCNMKRRSPSSSSPQDPAATPESEPLAKKILLEPSLAADLHLQLDGFTKIPLPVSNPFRPAPLPSSPVHSAPVLRRCSSDPVNSPGTQNPGAPRAQSPDSVLGLLSNPPSPDNVMMMNVSATTPSPARGTGPASLPPLPPTLRRSVSDPTASASKTPPQPARTDMGWLSPRNLSRSSSSGDTGVSNPGTSDSLREESPNFKRLRRMKERMKEMSQWWDEVMRESEEEDGGLEVNNNNSNTTKDESETETEECVSVETVGDILCLHFRCTCGKGYQILIFGSNCYYKLI